MKLNINDELEAILLKNGLIKEAFYDQTIKILFELEGKMACDKKVGLYGVGIEAETLLNFIWKHTDNFRIDVCFDKTIRNYSYKNIVENVTVYPIESIIDMDIDYMIIGSFEYRKIFIENMNTIGYKGTIIDLYDHLEEYITEHFANYKMVYETRHDYLKAHGSAKKELLQKLIKQYLLIKDFINAFRYIDIYIHEKYDKYRQYEEIKKDLQKLLNEIKNCIKGKKYRNIIINWVDALSYYDVCKFPFLQKKSKEGVCFENAYTVMPWTTETTKTILSGEYPIEGKLFLREHLSPDNMKLLDIIEENGYKFGYCGMPKFAKLFDDTVIAPISFYDNKFSGSMQKQWDALNILCQSEIPMCILIHTLRETHEPFICGESDTFIAFGSSKEEWRKDECRKQAETAGKYINGQLEFYEKLYGENAIEINMSDHGRVGNSPLSEEKIHIMLMINGKDIQSESIKPMFSLVKFPELIRTILTGDNDWSRLADDYIVIENLDAYSEPIVQKTIEGKLNRDDMLQCRGIVTLADRYFLYCYGKEYYFVNNKLDENEIYNPIFADRISELKEICGTEFVNVCLYDKFKYSRQLYKHIKFIDKYEEVNGKT